jgi:hypothetical protein
VYDRHAALVLPCVWCVSVSQEKFEGAVEEYKTAQDMLARVEGGHTGHKRRWAGRSSRRCGRRTLVRAVLAICRQPPGAVCFLDALHGRLKSGPTP